ncbi:hypothetical protein AK830_g2104 [Neonectria ditissima]|uniref:Uncharacterized protein n=1 Tax=Neonectria ditissima TaxID=78410 RepID=A0A0P7BVH9_9HYPO|nr:hypothetical protein AK830_g2104 [Neonectria ditissima]
MSSSSDDESHCPQGFVSSEAQGLIEKFSLGQCMSFIYNTGYSKCTEHCCGHSISEPHWSMFGPNIDPAESPRGIWPVAKLRQWMISTETGDAAKEAGDSAERISRFISEFSRFEFTKDHTWAADDLAMIPHINKDAVPQSRLDYLGELDRQRKDPTVSSKIREIKASREAVESHFATSLFFKLPPAWLADTVFWSRPTKGYDELCKGYLAWRKLWHVYVFREDEAISCRLENIQGCILPLVPRLRMWGNVQNDYNLYHFQELSRKELRYMYEQEPESLLHMLSNLVRWKEECQILNDFVGLRRGVCKEKFHETKRAAQRAGSAMVRVVAADNHNSSNLKRESETYTAKLRFLEFRAALCSGPVSGVLEA